MIDLVGDGETKMADEAVGEKNKQERCMDKGKVD